MITATIARMCTLATVLAVTVLLSVSGCGVSAPAPKPAPFGVPTASPSAAPSSVVLTPEEEEILGPRVELPGGLLLKQFGKVAQWGDEYRGVDDWDIRVVLDSVEVDPRCDKYASPPKRGHRLLLSLRVETGPGYDQSIHGGPWYHEWSTVGTDGVSEAPMSASYSCREAGELPHEMRPSAKYRGTVIVDTANTRGQLVLRDAFVWNYP